MYSCQCKKCCFPQKKHFAKFITLEREIYCVDCRKPFLISNKCFSALRHKPKNEKISSEIIKYFSSLLLVKTPEISDKQLKSKKRKVDNSTIHLTPYCSDRYYDRFNYVPSKTIKYYGTNP